jgi:hypothetical protein
MKRICYGESNFPYVIRSNGYYVDKTRFIEKLEGLGSEYLFFLRPRRFGKSLFLSTLETYYDINTADSFDELFGDLYIGKNPTPLRNSFPILKFNFSRIRGDNSVENIEDAFNLNIMSCIETFYVKYPKETGGIKVFEKDVKHLEKAEKMFDRFLEKMAQSNVKFYLLIDEYDNFANNILAEHGKETYYSLTHGTGFLRTFFTVIKAGTDSKTIARMFATGVTPLVLSDVTSGFNMGINISLHKDFHELAGFTEADVREIVDYQVEHGLISENIKNSLLYTMKKYYDGYLFSSGIKESLYNSTSILYLIHQYNTSYEPQKHELPQSIIDSNLMTDYRKLEFLVLEKQKLNGNFKDLSEILLTGECEEELVDSFSVKELSKGSHFTSFLFYLGLITIKEKTFLNTVFTIPNEACRHMLWEYIRTALDSALRLDFSKLRSLYTGFAARAEWKQYFEAIFEQAYHVTSNRDFKYGESVIKGIILGYLTQANVYLIQSERELSKCYTDLYLEPMLWMYPQMSEMRYLIELKYLKAEEITEDKKEKSVAKAKAAAITQLDQYAKRLKLANVPVTKLVIIASSKELLLLEEVAI